MISIFRNNLFINSLLLLPYVIILRIKTLMRPVGYEVSEADTHTVKTIFNWLEAPLLQSSLAILIVYLQAVYINRLSIKHRMGTNFTLIPGLLYVILTSMMPEYTSLSPHLIANGFILVVIGQLFKIYKQPRVADHIFNVGFYIALSSLFVPNFIYLLIIALFSMFILRSVKQKELIQLVSGSFTLFFLFYGGLYLYDISIINEMSKMNFSPKLSIFQMRGMGLYKFVGWILIAVFVVINYSTYTFKMLIQSQKKVDILFWFLLASGVLLFIDDPVVPYNLLLMCIPLSFFLCINLLRLKNPLIQEVIHVVLVGLVFAFTFGVL